MSALIVIDMQNDFCPGGALGVPGGDEIIPLVNYLIHDADHVIMTQDWHPVNHISFAFNHPGKIPFDYIETPYGSQVLWPGHCIWGSFGADFHSGLSKSKTELIIRKGFHPGIDSYSAFFENDHTTPTGLTGYLRERGINEVTLVGLATDYCVAFSALDAVRQGFKTTVRLDACCAINLDGSLVKMMNRMSDAGVILIK